MGYKIVEIEEGWKVIYSLENIIVYIGDKKANIPINDISIIMFNNISTNISIRLLTEFAKKSILAIFCDEKHLPIAYSLPISGHYNSLKKIQQQYEWDENWKIKRWTKIVELKIKSQIIFIKFNNDTKENYEHILKDIKDGDITNKEAMMAAIYFKIIFGKNFERRSEKDDYNTYVNSFLNYGYTILMSYVARSITKNGYDTRIAIWHKSFSNHTALASDLMEPFRVIVDCCVYKLIREIKQDQVYLTSEIKKKLVVLFTKQIIYNNERMDITVAIDTFVQDVLNKDDLNKIKLEYLFNQY